MSVNSLLYKPQYQNSLLGVLDSSRNARATSGGALSLLSLGGLDSSDSWASASDTVSLALSGVSERIMEDLAAETEAYVKDHPSLQGDWVLAVIDGQDGQREVRAFRRSELTASQAKTETGQKLLDGQLKKNPILCYSSADQLPTAADPDDQETAGLSERLTKFLGKNKKVLDILAREGFSPFGTAG